MSVEVIFETHSLSEDNERGIATGWLGGRLSERGRQLAEELGERRRPEGVAAVYTSDLARAVETATIGFGRTDVPILADWRLRECNYGSLNGMSAERLERERPLRLDTPFPGGESWRQAVERHGWFLNDVVRRHDGDRVLVIGHVATWSALEHLVWGHTLEELLARPLEWQEGWRHRVDADVARRFG